MRRRQFFIFFKGYQLFIKLTLSSQTLLSIVCSPSTFSNFKIEISIGQQKIHVQLPSTSLLHFSDRQTYIQTNRYDMRPKSKCIQLPSAILLLVFVKGSVYAIYHKEVSISEVLTADFSWKAAFQIVSYIIKIHEANHS